MKYSQWEDEHKQGEIRKDHDIDWDLKMQPWLY